MTRFTEDDRIAIENNAVERLICPTALWKNALFAGSDQGAEHRAIIASVVETCTLNDVDPLACWLTLTGIVNGQAATSMNCFRGPLVANTSKLWPEKRRMRRIETEWCCCE
ncbi:transposase [Bradyrhizobium japonicum]|nr:transposase [Bradyrhizobium japonicum]